MHLHLQVVAVRVIAEVRIYGEARLGGKKVRRVASAAVVALDVGARMIVGFSVSKIPHTRIYGLPATSVENWKAGGLSFSKERA